MLDREAALAVAAAFLEADSQEYPEDEPVRTIPERAFADGTDLIVPYGSVASLDHGVKDAELAGNVPIRVNTITGECEFIDLDDVLAYRRRGFTV
jgi:hypothetical protein